MKPRLFSRPEIDASKKEEILNAAQKVFADVGFKEATVRQICKEAKANVCLISYYFGGKDGLYKSIIDRVGEARLSAVQKLLSDEHSITNSEEYRTRLQLFLKAMYEELQSKPEFLRMMNREIIDGMPRAEDVVKKYIGGATAQFAKFLEYGQKKKFLKKDLEPGLVAMSVVTMFIGFIMRQACPHSEFFFRGISQKDLPDKIIKNVTTMFLEGVLA